MFLTVRLNLNSSGTSADVKKPVFESMSIDKKEVQVGDEATITLKASDVGSGINRVYLSYSAPQQTMEKIIYHVV